MSTRQITQLALLNQFLLLCEAEFPAAEVNPLREGGDIQGCKEFFPSALEAEFQRFALRANLKRDKKENSTLVVEKVWIAPFPFCLQKVKSFVW